ncbi:MAG: hypothetical protein ACERKX_06075, partial [Anaerolineales bacterium]
MKPKIYLSILALTLSSVFLIGCGVLSAPEEASAPIEALPVESEEDVIESDAVEEPPETTPEADSSGGTVTLQIVQDESEARFEID